jgi:hypothetical protein
MASKWKSAVYKREANVNEGGAASESKIEEIVWVVGGGCV